MVTTRADSYSAASGGGIFAGAQPWPAWRQSMAVANRLYQITATAPGDTTGLLPSSGFPTHFGENTTGGFGAGWDVISGYSSGTHLPEVGGPFGTMVYGTGGHTRLQNQVLALDISADVPTWSWFLQPDYQTSDTAGANLYYDPTSGVQTVGEDGASWDRNFPVMFDGWVYPRALTTGEMGNSVPHGFRYASVCHVPASVTGSDPLLLATLGPQGPFAQAERPSNVSLSEWFNASHLYASGRRKWPIHALNLTTMEWSIIGTRPDVDVTGFTACYPWSVPADRKVYVSYDSATTNGCSFSIDFSGGLGAVTVGDVVVPATSIDIARYSSGALTVGNPDGKLLWVWPDSNNTGGIVIQDLIAGTNHEVDLTSDGLYLNGSTEKMGFSYDAANNRILAVTLDGNPPALSNGIACWTFNVPSGDHTDPANWNISKVVLSVDSGVGTLTSLTPTEFNKKTQYLPDLGVCLVPFHTTMLAFVPG